MADPTFPQKPEYGWKPQSGLAGMLYSRDRDRYEQMSGVEDVLTKARAGSEMERMPFETDIKRQEALKAGLANQFTQATQPGAIGVTQAQQGTQLGAEQLEQVHQGLVTLEALAQVGDSPMAPQQISQVLQRFPGAMNNEIVKGALSRVQSPKQLGPMVTHLRNYLQQYRQTMDQTRMQETGATERARIAADAQMRSARIGKQPVATSPYIEMTKENDPMKIVVAATKVMSDPNASGSQKAHAKVVLEENMDVYRFLVETKQLPPLHPSLPSTPRPQMPFGQQPGPTPQPGANDPLGIRR